MESHDQTTTEVLVTHLFRHQAGRIVATLTRVLGSRHLDLAEDAVQDALITALQQWPYKGIPENPAAWLAVAAKNRALNLIPGGLRHLAQAAAGTVLTTYHLQAEIAAIHAVAVSDAATDWECITNLYDELLTVEPTPVVLLNRAIALARWQGSLAGIEALKDVEQHASLQDYHLLPAVLAEFWKQAGDAAKAADYYRQALACPCTEPERRFLQTQLLNAVSVARP